MVEFEQKSSPCIKICIRVFSQHSIAEKLGLVGKMNHSLPFLQTILNLGSFVIIEVRLMIEIKEMKTTIEALRNTFDKSFI
ncbi:hypothetical protein BpHYR1_038606 [Brachionus plicatilis]|uniref:Uncharacterized protein n=1 Tax=Brachionus plicatilis TaxID=10195 RepID=A0A3M7RL90_BRAPC|nr:hypothetical protein BpHYR1_038606 [Brachionus plicatilis]